MQVLVGLSKHLRQQVSLGERIQPGLAREDGKKPFSDGFLVRQAGAALPLYGWRGFRNIPHT